MKKIILFFIILWLFFGAGKQRAGEPPLEWLRLLANRVMASLTALYRSLTGAATEGTPDQDTFQNLGARVDEWIRNTKDRYTNMENTKGDNNG